MDRLVTGDVIYFMFLFVPFFLLFWFIVVGFRSFREYQNKNFLFNKKKILLEIRLPEENRKTPLAMELVLNGMHEDGRSGDWLKQLVEGKTRPIFSFEIASMEGQVRFFIWAEADYRPRIESQIYAHYPSAEVVEVDDYTGDISYFDEFGEPRPLFSFEFGLTKPDPYPIKTYKNFGLDTSSTKEEEKTDPIAQTLESLASIGAGEYMWVQIVTRAHKKSLTTSVSFFDWFASFLGMFNLFAGTDKVADHVKVVFSGKKPVAWGNTAKKLIEEIQERRKVKNADGTFQVTDLSYEDKLLLQALQENVSKPAYDCGLRTVYMAKDSASFKPSQRVNVMGSLFKAYKSDVFNSFKPNFVTDYDFPWMDIRGKNMERMKEDIFRDYRARKYFFSSQKYAHGKKRYGQFTLSSEELATIYHFPGQVVQTPTFDRIDSTTGEAPSNLPV